MPVVYIYIVFIKPKWIDKVNLLRQMSFVVCIVYIVYM